MTQGVKMKKIGEKVLNLFNKTIPFFSRVPGARSRYLVAPVPNGGRMETGH